MSSESKKGFTIIEVVLVLAIAGLIFLMVFIALPALQRNQRNTQRGNDLSRFLTAMTSYQSNNNGKLPVTSTNGVDKNFVNRYVDKDCTTTDGLTYNCAANSDQFRDPDGEPYKTKFVKKITNNTATGGDAISPNANGATSKSPDHTFYIYLNATCGDEGKVLKGSGEREVAVFYYNEGGSISCNDNH